MSQCDNSSERVHKFWKTYKMQEQCIKDLLGIKKVKKRIRKKGNLSAQLKDSQINYSLKMERKARIENNTNIFVIKRMRQE